MGCTNCRNGCPWDNGEFCKCGCHLNGDDQNEYWRRRNDFLASLEAEKAKLEKIVEVMRNALIECELNLCTTDSAHNALAKIAELEAK